MKICIFGAGAIGGYMAVEMALAGFEVSVVARGRHLEAIQQRGLIVRTEGIEKVARLPASDDPAAFGPQDFVICALKAHQALASAPLFSPLLGRDTAVVTAMNGIPWWYFYAEGGTWDGHRLDSVDPGSRQWKFIGPERAIGCIVEPACEVAEPGIIEHHRLKRFILGEPDGRATPRIEALHRVLETSGFEAPMREAIRWNIWLKLFGNVCFSPIGVLTHATLARTVGDPGLRALCRTLMLEAQAVARALGVMIPDAMIDRRLDAAAAVGEHKMSMLQDLERGRPLEIDALVAVVQELAHLVGVATPTLDTVLALAQARGRAAGLYPEAKP